LLRDQVAIRAAGSVRVAWIGWGSAPGTGAHGGGSFLCVGWCGRWVVGVSPRCRCALRGLLRVRGRAGRVRGSAPGAGAHVAGSFLRVAGVVGGWWASAPGAGAHCAVSFVSVGGLVGCGGQPQVPVRIAAVPSCASVGWLGRWVVGLSPRCRCALRGLLPVRGRAGRVRASAPGAGAHVAGSFVSVGGLVVGVGRQPQVPVRMSRVPSCPWVAWSSGLGLSPRCRCAWRRLLPGGGGGKPA